MRTACFIALLLLASPLLAVDTWATWSSATTNTITANSFKVANAVDTTTAANTRFGIMYMSASAKTAADTAYCLAFGITGASSTAADWKGSDIVLISGTTTGTGTSTVVAAATTTKDVMCKTTTSAGFCSFQGFSASAEATQNWMVVSGVTPWATWASGTTVGTYTWEIGRNTAVGDATVDLAFTAGTSGVAVGFMAGVCPTTDGDLTAGTTIASQFDIPTAAIMFPANSALNVAATTTTAAASFSNMSFVSLIALLISFALLN